MAEALFRRCLEERGVPATVTSAGLMDGGRPATDDAIATMAADGLDIAGHLSRQITRPMITEADLVVAMTRQQVVEATVMAPDAWPRIFGLRELVGRAEAVGPRPADQPFAAWLAQVGEGRTRSSLLAASLADDVADPIGQSRAVYERTRKLLDDQLTRLAGLL